LVLREFHLPQITAFQVANIPVVPHRPRVFICQGIAGQHEMADLVSQHESQQLRLVHRDARGG
jgi:hypothetical protein